MTKALIQIRKFAAASSGTVTVEFVASLPVLIGALAFCFELGRAFLAYEIASSDVQSATRYLSRAPALNESYIAVAQNLAQCGVLTPGTCTRHWPWNADVTPGPIFSEATILCSQTNTCANCNNVGTNCLPFNQDITEVQVKAEIPMTLSLLGYLGVNTLYTMHVVDQTLWIGS